jgi:hypothetical protein
VGAVTFFTPYTVVKAVRNNTELTAAGRKRLKQSVEEAKMQLIENSF